MTNTDYLKTVGMEVRVARIRKGLSIREVAKLTGLCESSLNQLENGKHDVKILTYKRIADALGISIKDIL